MKTKRRLHGMLVVMAVGVTAPSATAQTPALDGTWLLDPQRSEDAREMLAARMGGRAVMRAGEGAPRTTAARSGAGGGVMMLRGGGPLVASLVQAGERIRIEVADEMVHLEFDGSPAFVLPLNGTPTGIERWDHAVVSHATLRNGTLTIETTGENGVAFREIFTATEAGEIAAELHITFPSMGGPQEIIAQRTYRKAAGAER